GSLRRDLPETGLGAAPMGSPRTRFSDSSATIAVASRTAGPSMPRRRIRLTDAQLEIVMTCAQQYRPQDRSRLLRLVADKLRACAEIGDGHVNAALREATSAMTADRLRWLS